VIRFLGRWTREEQKHEARGRLVILGSVALTPVCAFWLDWRLGLFVLAVFAVLAFGMLNVSNER
jgi:hypothetical protein